MLVVFLSLVLLFLRRRDTEPLAGGFYAQSAEMIIFWSSIGFVPLIPKRDKGQIGGVLLAIGYWIWAIGLDWIAAPLLFLPLTSNLSTRLSFGEQRLPRQRRQRTATLPMDHRQGNFALDHLHHHRQLDYGGW